MNRLEQLRSLRQRIDLEIERETRYQQRVAGLRKDLAKVAATTRQDWTWRVIAASAAWFSVTPDEVLNGLRHNDVRDARHVAFWVLRDTGKSYVAVGRALGKDHTTAIHGCRRVEQNEALLATAIRLRDQLTAEEEVA